MGLRATLLDAYLLLFKEFSENGFRGLKEFIKGTASANNYKERGAFATVPFFYFKKRTTNLFTKII